MDLLNASFKIMRLFDIDVRVHILFIFYILYLLFQAGSGWQDAALYLAMLFGIVLVHEFGHCFGARAVGGDARDILMWPLGGLAFAHAPMTPWAQFVTVACGPLVNLIFCLISAAALIIGAGPYTVLAFSYPFVGVYNTAPEWAYYAELFYRVNLFLLAFNLLPIYPLDGGQLFQCLLWPFVGLNRAMRIACQVGLAACVAGGLWSLSSGGGMLTFIAFFGGFTCWQRLQQLRFGMIVDERIKYAPVRVIRPKKAPFWSRVFGARRATTEQENPNPGGWERKLEEENSAEREVDRILQKVHDKGIHSLSYVERQTLERATRQRRRGEEELDRQTRL